MFVPRLVPVLTVKCTMADKSTKTDESLLNGDLEAACPTTTNAATMTTVVSCESPVLRAATVSVANSTGTRTTHAVQHHQQQQHHHQQQQVSRPADPPKQPPTPPPPLVRTLPSLHIV